MANLDALGPNLEKGYDRLASGELEAWMDDLSRYHLNHFAYVWMVGEPEGELS